MISIIIPVYNEAENIKSLIDNIFACADKGDMEIIVCDAGSTDDTINIALKAGAIAVTSPCKGRAAQMNYGASVAKAEVLYFVHADTRLHKNFIKDIELSIAQGYHLGCYRLLLDSKNPLLKINSFFTRFPFMWCRGGDQTLFMKRSVFKALHGFADMVIMEDYDIIQRAKEHNYRFKIIPENVTASARKYDTNGYFKVLKANYTIMKLWREGKTSDTDMAALYKQLLHYR